MNNKPYFAFNRSQRNGVFVLVFIVVLLFTYLLLPSFQKQAKPRLSTIEKQQVTRLQRKIDSLKQLKIAEKKPKIYPFNPNFITDYKGYTLGMSPEEIDRLHTYRAKDKWVNSIEDFQNVTKISDSLLVIISPYFDFPDWVIQREKNKATKEKTHIKTTPKKDLNQATFDELIAIKGIGKTLAKRILRYRRKIGGFVDAIQLKDIYGLDYKTTQHLTNKFSVIPAKKIKKLSLNTASVAELSEVVYFNYELARDIVEYRTLHEGIASFEELAKIDNFPAYQIERIKLYLTLQ